MHTCVGEAGERPGDEHTEGQSISKGADSPSGITIKLLCPAMCPSPHVTVQMAPDGLGQHTKGSVTQFSFA
jgi:hypothetical protein